MRKKTAVAALSVLALAPALAACGSSAKSSAAASGAATATTSASAKATSTATSKATSTATAMASKAAAGKAKASTGANGCTPVSKKGNCYQPKEFCAKTQHGTSGVAGDGKKIVCKDVSGQWVWQLA